MSEIRILDTFCAMLEAEICRVLTPVCRLLSRGSSREQSFNRLNSAAFCDDAKGLAMLRIPRGFAAPSNLMQRMSVFVTRCLTAIGRVGHSVSLTNAQRRPAALRQKKLALGFSS